jgi:hypothetical protein
MVASRNGHREIVSYFLESKVNVNAQDNVFINFEILRNLFLNFNLNIISTIKNQKP